MFCQNNNSEFMDENIYDVIIIGGGPAGITAGIYACREKLKTLLVAKGFGGQVARKAVAIENYPGFEEISGVELIQRFKNQLKSVGAEIKQDEIRKIEKIEKGFNLLTVGGEKFQTRAIIISSGADPRHSEAEGEKEFIGKGVSYCTLCDAPMFQDKIVAVLGGGNAGFEAALALTNYAKKIYILEYADKVNADEDNQEMVYNSGKIEVIVSSVLKNIQGERFVNSIVYQDRKSMEMRTLNVQGVFIEIGSQPVISFVNSWVEFNERDEIKIDPKTCETKTPGIFAAGDVTDVMLKQIIVAAGEGAKAAISARNYLRFMKK